MTRYFTEVKYRHSSRHGDGFAAVTSKKLQQMRFAAELYASRFPTAKLMKLCVASVNAQNETLFIELD